MEKEKCYIPCVAHEMAEQRLEELRELVKKVLKNLVYPVLATGAIAELWEDTSRKDVK